MAAIRPSDPLFQAGARCLERYGVPAIAGGGRPRTDEFAGTFARADAATVATYIDRDGLIRRAAAHVLRIDYEPYYLGGLLTPRGGREFGFRLEPARTNSCLWSEELNTAPWTANGATVTANARAAPDGTATMDKLVETALTELHQRFQAITITDSEYVAISCFVAAGERDRLRFIFVDGGTGNYFGALPNLGTVAVNGTQSGTGTLVLARMWGLPGGIYRVEAVGRLPAGVTAARVYCGLVDAGGNVNYAGDGVSGAYYWGVQVERLGIAGPMQGPSSYMKTEGDVVTRAGDALSYPVPWGNEIPFSVGFRMSRPFYADVVGTLGSATIPYIIGTSNGNVRGAFGSGSRVIEATIDSPGTDQFTNAAIIAGNPINYLANYKDLRTAPKSRVDLGAGMPAYSSGAAAMPGFTNQTIGVGHSGGTAPLGGVLIDLSVLRGEFTLAEYLKRAA